MTSMSCADSLAGRRGRRRGVSRRAGRTRDLITAFSEHAARCGGDFADLELNPVTVCRSGVVAVDALAMIRQQQEVMP
jgi:hypothetical protein